MANAFDRATEEINPLLWWAGWHARYTWAGVTASFGIVGYFAADTGMAIMLGFLGAFIVGPVAFFIGMRHVNGNYKTVLSGFDDAVANKIERITAAREEDDPATYALRNGSGSKPLRVPSMRYEVQTLLVTEYSIIIHDDAKLDMVGLSLSIGDSTEEVYFDTVTSVNYTDGEFWINRSDQHGHSWPSEREPEDALDDIQDRLREYKRQSA